MNLSMIFYILGWILLCECALLALPLLVAALYLDCLLYTSHLVENTVEHLDSGLLFRVVVRLAVPF